MSQPATWTVHHATSGTSSAIASLSAVSGKSHYLCGFIASCDMGTSILPESVECTITYGPVMGAVVVSQFTFTATSQKKDTTAYSSYASPTGAPLMFNFSSPIRIPENKLLKLTVDPLGSGSAVQTDATIWGFTATDITTPA